MPEVVMMWLLSFQVLDIIVTVAISKIMSLNSIIPVCTPPEMGKFPGCFGRMENRRGAIFQKGPSDVVSDLKLRASWGKSGRDSGNSFKYYEGYSFGYIAGGFIFNPGTLTLGMVPPGISNSNLTWVNTTTTDLCIDLDMWRGMRYSRGRRLVSYGISL